MFARHELVWLSEAGWRQALASALSALSAGAAHAGHPAPDLMPAFAPGLALRPGPPLERYLEQETVPDIATSSAANAAAIRAAIADWRQAGWPAVVRRADIGQASGEVAIGLALPPRAGDGHKLRIACRVAAREVVRRAPALLLAQVLDALTPASGSPPFAAPLRPTTPSASAPPPARADQAQALVPETPPHWPSALRALDTEAAARGLELRVFGSLALQALTGRRYLGAGSDIDLLLQPRDRAALDAGLALLRRHAARLPLDGEIVFPDGCAVAWKEWSAAIEGAPGARVLAKAPDRVALLRTEQLLAGLEEAACG